MRPITVLYYEPGKDPRTITTPGDLASLQGLVGGYIEAVTLEPGLVLICNEEGKVHGLQPNRLCPGVDMIVGSFFVTGSRGPNFVSLTESQISKTLSLFEWTQA